MIVLLAWLPWFRRWFGGSWYRADRVEQHYPLGRMSDQWLSENRQK